MEFMAAQSKYSGYNHFFLSHLRICLITLTILFVETYCAVPEAWKRAYQPVTLEVAYNYGFSA